MPTSHNMTYVWHWHESSFLSKALPNPKHEPKTVPLWRNGLRSENKSLNWIFFGIYKSQNQDRRLWGQAPRSTQFWWKPDPISQNFVSPHLGDLVSVCNCIACSSVYCLQWEHAFVVSIPKSTSFKGLVNQLISISLLLIPSKLVEAATMERLMCLLESHKCLFDAQYKFRKQKTCNTTLLDLMSMHKKRKTKRRSYIYVC